MGPAIRASAIEAELVALASGVKVLSSAARMGAWTDRAGTEWDSCRLTAETETPQGYLGVERSEAVRFWASRGRDRQSVCVCVKERGNYVWMC